MFQFNTAIISCQILYIRIFVLLKYANKMVIRKTEKVFVQKIDEF